MEISSSVFLLPPFCLVTLLVYNYKNEYNKDGVVQESKDEIFDLLEIPCSPEAIIEL